MDVPESVSQYAWLIPYMPLLATVITTVMFVRFTKVLVIQWLPIQVMRLFPKADFNEVPRPYRKPLTGLYSIVCGGLSAGYFIERDYLMWGLEGPKWRVVMALTIPLLVYVYIQAFQDKDNVMGRVAKWLSGGHYNALREEQLVEDLQGSGEKTVFRALNAAGVDTGKYHAKRKEKDHE